MELTLTQWQELAALKQSAMEALDTFERKALDLALANEDSATREYMVKVSSRSWEAQQTLSSCDVQVVSEWMGGDSSDPKNTKLREPQSCGLSNRRYF